MRPSGAPRAIARVATLLDGAQSVTIATLRAKIAHMQMECAAYLEQIAQQAKTIARLDALLVGCGKKEKVA